MKSEKEIKLVSDFLLLLEDSESGCLKMKHKKTRIRVLTVGCWCVCIVLICYLLLTVTLYGKKPKIVADTDFFRTRVQGQSHNNLQSANEDFLRKTGDSFKVVQRENDDKSQEENLQLANERFLGIREHRVEVRDVNLKPPVHHVAFLKVHKTASSTAQNLFLRYGDARNLTFVLAHTKGESGWLNVISYNNSITTKNIVPPPPGCHFDILCCHVIYDRNAFEAVLPKDTVYIGIVREPVSRFQSAVKYFSPNFILKLPGKSPLSVYAKNPLAFEPENPKLSQTNNRMALEFGFPLELFPGKSLNGSKAEVERYITRLDKEFQFIIISEKFDESMVLMKRLLHWDIKDVLYVDKNVFGKMSNTRKILPDEDKPKIREFLYLDQAVYDFALAKFNKLAAVEGEDFLKEVEHFKVVVGDTKTFCTNSKANSMHMQASKWHGDFTVTKSDCKLYSKHEKDLIQKQRFRQYGVLEN